MPCFHSTVRGTSGQLASPSLAWLHRLPDVHVRMTQHQQVTAASPAPDPVRDARLLAPRHQVIDEDPEPPPFSRREVGHDTGEIVDAAEVLDHHPNVAQVVAPDLLHQLGVVATLDINPAGQRDLGPTGRSGDRTRGSPRWVPTVLAAEP